MKRVFIVRAFYDKEASVWCAESVNFIGLATEASSVDELLKKIPPMLDDLLECGMDSDGEEIPLQLLVETTTVAHHPRAQ